MRYFVSIDATERIVDVVELPGGGFDVHLVDLADDGTDASSRPLPASLLGGAGQDCALTIGGNVYDLVLDGEPPKLELFANGRRASVGVETARMRAAANVRGATGAGPKGLVTSPMPGKVVKLLVKEGDEVQPGAPLIVVEAMKMENELCADLAGVVKKVFVSTGDTVEGGARLIAVE